MCIIFGKLRYLISYGHICQFCFPDFFYDMTDIWFITVVNFIFGQGRGIRVAPTHLVFLL